MERQPPVPAPGRPRRWVLFFVVLAVLAAVAVVVPIVYNLGLQLKPGQAAEARARWREHGPRDYDLRYRVKVDRDPEADEYVVRVRKGEVVLVGCNGGLLYVPPVVGVAAGPAVRALPPVDPRDYGVEALLREIEATAAEDAARGSRNYATAAFDPHDGHPLHYVHRVRGTSRRLEWNVRLERVGE